MKEGFAKYSLEELIENREFVAWVVRGENQKEWETFLLENPELKATAKKARKIVELLRDKHESISEDDILKIWNNIESFDTQIKNHFRQFKLHRILRYAAVLVFALLIGGSAGYWMISQNQKSYVFTGIADSGKYQQSRLFLSDGTNVNLEKENSKIALDVDKQLVINNEKVIDLSKTNNPDEAKMNEVFIPYGKKSQLILEDGTKVWLNAGSKLAFPTKFTGKKREVFLEGEAYFEVAHNQKLPFFVNTGEIVLKVLGTKFNLSAYKTDQLIETVLIDGKVTVSKQSLLGFLNSETILAPNQKASFDKENKSISVKSEPDVEFAIAWTEGWFMYSQQDLKTVLNKLQRYYNVQFIFDSGFQTTDQITGKLDLKDSIEKVMIALADVAKIQFRIADDKIYIGKKITELKMR